MFGTVEYTAVMEQDHGTELIVDFEDGTTEQMSGAEVYAVIFQPRLVFECPMVLYLIYLKKKVLSDC